jgi:hypothetical protein
MGGWRGWGRSRRALRMALAPRAVRVAVLVVLRRQRVGT